MNVMIFAAGFGTRMQPLTFERPKALVKVAGQPLMDHALAQARAANPEKIVVNGHHHADQLKAYLADHPDVTFTEEQPQPFETGGGLKAALPLLGPDPVITLNSDAIWTGPAAVQTLQAAWNPARMDTLLLLVPPEGVSGTPGGWRLRIEPDGQIIRAPEGLIFTGAAIHKTDGLAAIHESAFSLRELWVPQMENGRVHGVVHPGSWRDVGTPEGIRLAEELLANG